MSTERNGFEATARAKKVAKLLAAIPAAKDDTRVAKLLAGWSQSDRDRFAAAHGVKSPSVRTWNELLCALVSRREDSEFATQMEVTRV